MNIQEDFTQTATLPGRRYLTHEDIYRADHPAVVHLTDSFSKVAKDHKLFANISASIKNRRSQAMAETMAGIWFDFTRKVPKFIAYAVSKTNDPERQHSLIQIAHDELGGHDKSQIHSKLFVDAVDAIGIRLTPESSCRGFRSVLVRLDAALADASRDAGIIGLLLALEIPAQENIEMLFECLSFDEASRKSLSASRFFQIHRQDESEHIRHSVANYLRYCQTEEDRAAFHHSFESGLRFWERFWGHTARLINVATEVA